MRQFFMAACAIFMLAGAAVGAGAGYAGGGGATALSGGGSVTNIRVGTSLGDVINGIATILDVQGATGGGDVTQRDLDPIRFDLHNVAFRSLIADAQYSVPLYDGYLSVFTSPSDDWDESLSTNTYHVGRGNRLVGALTPGLGARVFDTDMNFVPATAIQITNGYTICLWYYPYETPAFAGIVVNEARSFLLSTSSSGDKITFGSLTSSNSIPVNQWHHLAITMAATGTGATVIYYNGAFDSQGTVTGAAYTNTAWSDLDFWYDDFSPDRRLRGVVDDMRLYTRALTAEEIATIYNGGSGQAVIQADDALVAAWTFEGTYAEYLSGVTYTVNNAPVDPYTNSVIAFAGTNFGAMVSDAYALTAVPDRVYGALWIDAATTNASMNTNIFYDVSTDNGTNWTTLTMEPQFIGALGYPIFYRGINTNWQGVGTTFRSRTRVTNSAAISTKGASRQCN